MTNQSGSAFWTCAVCGAMGSALDSSCPNCGAVRGATAPAAVPNPNPTSATPVTQSASSVSTAVQSLRAMTQNTLSPTCPTCGATNSWTNATCTSCGAALAVTQAPTAPRQRGVAIALAFLGGIVGAQYFYMGRRAAGVACVLMCWTGYSAALGFIEGLRLLTLSDSEFARECVG